MSDEVPRIDLIVDGDHPATIDLEVVTGGLTEQGTQELIDDALEGFDAGGEGLWTLTRDTGLGVEVVAQTTAADGSTITDTWGWSAYPDGNAGGFLKGATGTLRHYQPSEGVTVYKVGVTTVDELDLYAAPRDEVVVASVPGATYDWVGGGPIIDLGGGVGMMILHVERGTFGDPWFWWTLGCAKVVDSGVGAPTITWLGEIIQHELTEANALANSYEASMGSGQYLIHDGYVYVYHQDMSPTGEVRSTVSRCTLTDIGTAIDADDAPAFTKWNGEALTDTWTEPGLGGETQTLAIGEERATFEAVGTGDFLEIPDGRHLWVGTRLNSGDWSVIAAEVVDPLTFGGRITVLEPQSNREYIHGTAWSGNADAPKTVESTVLFDFVDALPADRWSDFTVERLELRPVVRGVGFQREVAYVSTSPGTVALADLPEPGKVVATLAGGTFVLPPLSGEPQGWVIANGSPRAEGGTVTVATTGADLINGVSEIEIRPEEVLHATTLIDSSLWVGWILSTGSRAKVYVFQAILYLDFPIEDAGVGATVSERVLSAAFLSGVFPADGTFLLANQTDPDDDGMYVALPDPLNPDFTAGDFVYAPDFEQPFRPHGISLPVVINTNLVNGKPVQGTIVAELGVYSIEPFAYTPAVESDWTDGANLTSIAAALDELAARLTVLEP